MSMPHEHTRAVIETQKFLKELRLRTDIPADVKESAIWLLRHYPDPLTVLNVGRAVMPNDDQNPFATSVEYEPSKRLSDLGASMPEIADTPRRRGD